MLLTIPVKKKQTNKKPQSSIKKGLANIYSLSLLVFLQKRDVAEVK